MDWVAREAEAVREIGAVPHILDIVCRTTDMRFAAVAHVTSDRWVTCASPDRLGFGPGDELDVTTTICHEGPRLPRGHRRCRRERDPAGRHGIAVPAILSRTAGASACGVGLCISAEIARAHGGSLSVESTAAATRFAMTMPLG